VTHAVPSRSMEKIEEQPTHRIVSFVDRRLAEHIERMARHNDRSVSSQVRVILRQALEAKRG
jgi:hypothetical protein